MDPVLLYVSVPVGCFRVAQAREYFETYPCPPPSTVYGMLLSLVGEQNRLRHAGAEVAVGLLSEPDRSVVLRTLWRIKDKKKPMGTDQNKRPDFQELLTDVRLVAGVRAGEEADFPLAKRVRRSLDDPSLVLRFGGLSLGESTHMVDELRPWRSDDGETARVLMNSPEGDLSMPVWPDHVGSRGTRWGQFRLRDADVSAGFPKEAWTQIRPPG